MGKCYSIISALLLSLIISGSNPALTSAVTSESGTITFRDYGIKMDFNVFGANITESTNNGWESKYFINGTVQRGKTITIAISGNGTNFSTWHHVNEDLEATMGISFVGTGIEKYLTIPPGGSGSVSLSYVVSDERSVKAYASIGNAWINPYGGGSRTLTLECNFDVVEPDTESEPEPEKKPLEIELSVADGTAFIQGDDLPIQALVTRGQSETVAGANVALKIISPNGKTYAQKTMDTDENGLADWRSFFTVCATTGNWKIVAEASADDEKAAITRTIALDKFIVSDAQVQANIKKIIQDWISNGQADGISQSFISNLWWPKGPKVNFYEFKDKRYAPYTCSSQAFETLKFLNTIRFSVQKERRLWMAGVDYGPISDGTSVVHVAVGIYPNGSDWLSGYVLEPWYNQKKESWNARAWSVAFFADPDTDWLLANSWEGEYPTTGSDGGYYPTNVLPDILKGPNKTRVLTYSPAFVLIADHKGGRPVV
jgi:hypothetical protein